MLFLLNLSFLFCEVVSIDTDTDLKETIELMRQEIQALKNERMMYNERLLELETEIRKGKTHFEMLSKLNNKRAKDQETPIAFSARFSHDLGYLTDNHIFVFDDVATNVGNRYDSKTGIFHCDKAGLYVFQLSMVAVPVLSGDQLYQLKKPEYPEKTTQLPHRGGQLYQLKKPEYPEKATRTATSHTLTLSQELVSSTPHHEQELN